MKLVIITIVTGRTAAVVVITRPSSSMKRTRSRNARPWTLVTCVTLAFGLASTTEAQWPKGRSRIVGTIRDSATAQPVIRSQVCRTPEGTNYVVCAWPDDTAGYVVDSLPAGRHVLTFSCVADRRFASHLLVVDTIELTDHEEVRLDVRRPTAGCDMRPYRVDRRVFAGFWTFGFEESRFRPCGDTISGWLDFTRDAIADTVKWPEPNDRNYPTVFVRFEGVLRGPGHFGHLGVSPYGFTGERLLEVRAADGASCTQGREPGDPTTRRTR